MLSEVMCQKTKCFGPVYFLDGAGQFPKQTIPAQQKPAKGSIEKNWGSAFCLHYFDFWCYCMSHCPPRKIIHNLKVRKNLMFQNIVQPPRLPSLKKDNHYGLYITTFSDLYYYMVSTMSKQDEPNRLLWLATWVGLGTTRRVPPEKFSRKPNNKSFIVKLFWSRWLDIGLVLFLQV